MRLARKAERIRCDCYLIPEKRLKRWRRAWKLALIEESNPTWQDLSDRIAR